MTALTPFTREELARELEDANRLSEARRLRIEALEDAWPSCTPMPRATSEAKTHGDCADWPTRRKSTPPQPAGGEAPERYWIERFDDEFPAVYGVPKSGRVDYVRADIHAAALARAEAAEKALRETYDAQKSVDDARPNWEQSQLTRLYAAFESAGKLLKRIDAARGKR